MTKKNLIIAAIVLLLIGGAYYVRRSRQTVAPATPTIEQVLQLPDAWKKAENGNVELELDKIVAEGYQPQIVLSKNEIAEAKTPAKYVDSLIKGAKSSIPSLKITNDKRNSEENLYTALLTGNYINQKQNISLIQRVYIKGQTVFVLTASYTGDLSAEINKILDSVANEKILK